MTKSDTNKKMKAIDEKFGPYKFQLRKSHTDHESMLGIWIEINRCIWDKWEKSPQAKNWDLVECQECGFISSDHLKAIEFHISK